tara:strand:- start:1191 stop:1829 length:639 start_codon:yes stop_codon:yes gene_type:complete
MTFPSILHLENYFQCPIWYADCPSFVSKLNKYSNSYIKESKKKKKNNIGEVFHSTTLLGDNNFVNFQSYVLKTCTNLLDEMGFDLTNYQLFLNEFWVQEFSKKGGGHHTLHTHWNGHMSGFYFLKASEKTSIPVFEDPRPGNLMNLLPLKDPSKVTHANSQIVYKVKPGRMIFFPSYLPHQFTVDSSKEPFRFIHWNCQAIPKGVINVFQKK